MCPVKLGLLFFVHLESKLIHLYCAVHLILVEHLFIACDDRPSAVYLILLALSSTSTRSNISINILFFVRIAIRIPCNSVGIPMMNSC